MRVGRKKRVIIAGITGMARLGGSFSEGEGKGAIILHHPLEVLAPKNLAAYDNDMPDKTPITVTILVNAPVDHVWKCWTEPEHIKQWNAASDDWHTPTATNDLREGGTFTSRMEAKDGSVGFDFGGTYTKVTPHALIEYVLGDGRTVSIAFDDQGGATHITETFDAEHENPLEMQREGWQSILNNFKQYTEAHARAL